MALILSQGDPIENRRCQGEDEAVRLEPAVRKVETHELEEACHLLARGMRDNPNNVRAFGNNADRRGRSLLRMFRPVLRRTAEKGRIQCAIVDGRPVGVCAAVAPGACQLNFAEKVATAPSIVFSNSPAAVLRVMRWTDGWSRYDPSVPHWHLGPVAADMTMQG